MLTTSLVQRDSVQNIVDFKTVLTLDNQNQTVASLQSESYITRRTQDSRNFLRFQEDKIKFQKVQLVFKEFKGYKKIKKIPYAL